MKTLLRVLTQDRLSQKLARSVVLVGLLTLLSSILPFNSVPSLFAAQTAEKTFQDPKSGKSGRYTIAVPDREVKPKSMGLLVFFHGSGATARYASGFDNLSSVANKTGLIPLALQAPNGADTWANHATGPSNQHDIYVKSLLDSLMPTLPALDRKRVIFVGFSAGSTFLSGDFLPRYIGDYKGGAVLLCGGGGPVTPDKALFTNLSKTTALAMPLAFYIQQKDFLYQQTVQGVEYWRARSAMIKFEAPAGGSHCGFDVNQEMTRLVKSVLEKQK